MNTSTLRFATYLSPNIYGTYEHIARYVGEKVGRPVKLEVGKSFEDFAEGTVDAAFICGLPYAQMAAAPNCPIELLAAPVLLGERYLHKPIYFSDIIVRNDSPYKSFDELAGCVWAYNQPTSHSGYIVVCYSLLERGKSSHYFDRTIASGSHLRSVQMVLEGQADAAAIDSHVLDVLLAQDRELASKIRVIDMLGPSTIPPVVVSKRVDNELKRRMREALLAMHYDLGAVEGLRAGRIERFAPVTDEDYADIRAMFARVKAEELSLAESPPGSLATQGAPLNNDL